MQTVLTDIEYCTCLYLFLNKHAEYAQLWYLSDYMDSDGLEFYYQIPDAAEKVQRMENDFYDFVKSIDRSQLYWDYVWKYAQSLIYTLKTLHNDNTEWVAEKLDIPVDIVRSIRAVLDEHVLLE